MCALRVALSQINSTVGDFEGNVSKILEAIRRAKGEAADIVVFPELAVCGYPPEDLLLRPGFLRDCRRAVENVARSCEGIIALVGFAEEDGGRVYNAAGVIRDADIAAVYRKIELPNYGVFDEKRYFSPGSGCVVFEAKKVPLMVTICEDVWVEKGAVERDARAGGARVVLNLSASPFHAGKLEERREVLAGFARRAGVFVCYANLVGGQDELVFDGGSLVVDPGGEVLASATRFEEDLLVVDLPVGAADERTLPGRRAPESEGPEEIYRALVLGTGDYVRKNGFEKVVIGLSGGIDSSLTAAIAVEALGNKNVIGVTMPSRYTSQETRGDAARVAENLDISLLTAPVEEIFSAYLTTLREPFGPNEPGIEHENLQARIRGNILMALSNRFGWLVLTTGNKSETAVGYCTLYGDMAGGFAIIKDVPKTLVYELSHYVNEHRRREIIPRGVLERAPSAELRPDQKDEDSLPPYETLDPILKAYVEEDRTPDEIAAAGYDPELVQEVVRMVDRSEYKRRQAPPGVKITPRAFGRDRRLPITNRYQTGKNRKP